MGQARWVIVLVVSVLSFFVPATLCLGLALAPGSSLADLIAAGVAAGGWMALLVLVNWWEFTGIWLRWGWSIALVTVALRRAYAPSGSGSVLGPVRCQ